MSISRLKYITKIGVEQMGDLANSLKDPSVLRLENLDTNISPPKEAIEHTREAVYQKNSNSYLPFIGKESLRKEVTNLVNKNSGQNYDWKTIEKSQRIIVEMLRLDNDNKYMEKDGLVNQFNEIIKS